VSAAQSDLGGDLAGYRREMGWANRDLIRRHHGARRHVTKLVDVLRGPAPLQPEPVTAVGEVARLARASWDAERHAMTLQAEAVTLRERTIAAEWDAESSRKRLAEIEEQLRADAAAWRERAEQAEADAAQLQGLLDTRRARIGMAAGRLLDRMRGVR
jgi:hypothetical protein